MRIFTAIPLPDDVRKKVSEITSGRLSIPYVNTTNLHITLNFFGEVTDKELVKIKEILPKITANHKIFKVEFNKLAKFHNQIHLTLKSNTALGQLQKELEQAFKAEGYKFNDREFYPHVKLANLHMDKVMHAERKTENFPNSELTQLSFVASFVVLYESKLLLYHAHHYPLLEVKLAL